MKVNFDNSAKKFKAFSLLELSVVILVTGILIAGITLGDNLLWSIRMSSAKSYTKGSDVTAIDGLILWLEPTLDESFDKNEADESHTVSNWYDITPQNSSRNKAISSGSNRPTYKSECLNGLPCLEFTKANSTYFDTANSIDPTTAITIFFVTKFKTLPTAGDFAFLLGTNGAWAAQNTHYQLNNSSGNITYTVNPSTDYAFSNFKISTNYIITLVDDNSTIKNYVNGVANSNSPISATTGTKNLGILNIGSWYNGTSRARFLDAYVAEIIIFNRDLEDGDRQKVEKYLSKKWGIK